MDYEVKGEARTRKVTPGEMALMRGAVALLSEMHPVMPGDMVVTWGDDSDWLWADSKHTDAACVIGECIRVIVKNALDGADPADLALLMELVRTSEVVG